MKSVLISIKPEWCKLIASGEKTIEIRKNKPKIDTPFKCYIYQTKCKVNESYGYKEWARSGKVVGEFVCDRIINIDCDSTALFDKETHEEITLDTCMSRDMFWQYTHGYCAVGWHISDLIIYDKPKKLSVFGLSRPPQSWCYVKDGEQE